jgi:glycosyltransferase involved in cell wall biosynthesis
MTYRFYYVSPFAHTEGHFSYAAQIETRALSECGQVVLITFLGTRSGQFSNRVTQQVVGPTHGILNRLVVKLERRRYARFPLLFVAAFTCLVSCCIQTRKENNAVILLRDSDPFLFLPHVMSFFFPRRKWLVSVIGIYRDARLTPKSIIGSRIWKPIVLASLRKGEYTYLCQHESILKYYSVDFLDGALARRLRVVPPLVPDGRIASNEYLKARAREGLGIPVDSFVMLSFGAAHPGKDLRLILNAVDQLPGIFLVHAGRIDISTKAELGDLSQLPSGKYIIRDAYVAEDEKESYFVASDVGILSYKKEFMRTPSMLWECCRFGLPVIASETAQLKELLERYNVGTLFEPGSVASLRRAIAYMQSISRETRATMKRNSERFIQAYSAEAWRKAVLSAAQSLNQARLSDANQEYKMVTNS